MVFLGQYGDATPLTPAGPFPETGEHFRRSVLNRIVPTLNRIFLAGVATETRR
jgi:hypothetical protein